MRKQDDLMGILRVIGIIAGVIIVLNLILPIISFAVPLLIIAVILYLVGYYPEQIKLNNPKVTQGFNSLALFKVRVFNKFSLDGESKDLPDMEGFPSEVTVLPEFEKTAEIHNGQAVTLPCEMPPLKAGYTPCIQEQNDTVYFLSRYERLDNPYFREKN